MSKVDSIKIELRLHEILFFIGACAALMFIILLVGRYESASVGWRIAMGVLASAASGFSVWNCWKFKRLLRELRNV
jgi:hypothetical protein